MNKHYVYALINPETNDPIYIGSAAGVRINQHLQHYARYSPKKSTPPIYSKINELMEKGIRPRLFKIKSGLPEALARSLEAELIWLVGTRKAGTGPLYNVRMLRPVICWGEVFQSLKALGKDPRCQVKAPTLEDRVLTRGWAAEQAATTPVNPEIICWDTSFPNLKTLAKDARCIVKYERLWARINRLDWTPERAATTPSKLFVNPHRIRNQYSKS